MKKILILAGLHPHKGSGVEKVAWEYGKRLSERYGVIYFFMDHEKIYEKKGNIEYYGFNAGKIPLLNVIIYIIKTLFFIKKHKPDLIIDNGGFTTLYNLFDHSIRIIGVLHGTCRSFIKKVKYSNILERIRYFLFFGGMSIFERNLIRNAHKIVLLSKHTKEEIEKYYKIFNNKYIYIYNGYDALNNQLQKKTSETVTILFVSNAHRVKGIDILEKVAKKLENRNVVFKIIGAKYNNMQHNNIQYLGKLSRDEVYKNMKEADVFLFPSYREGQPLVVFEAMSQGCVPLISGECHMDMLETSPLKEYISRTNDWRFYLKKITYFADHIDKIYSYKKLSMKTIAPYSRKNQTQKYYELISKEIG